MQMLNKLPESSKSHLKLFYTNNGYWQNSMASAIVSRRKQKHVHKHREKSDTRTHTHPQTQRLEISAQRIEGNFYARKVMDRQDSRHPKRSSSASTTARARRSARDAAGAAAAAAPTYGRSARRVSHACIRQTGASDVSSANGPHPQAHHPLDVRYYSAVDEPQLS
jgi:hypothetical protein